MKKIVRKFSIPSWVIMCGGVSMDFVLVIVGKYKTFPVKYETFGVDLPVFSCAGFALFILLNVPKWYREYKQSNIEKIAKAIQDQKK